MKTKTKTTGPTNRRRCANRIDRRRHSRRVVEGLQEAPWNIDAVDFCD